MKTKTDLKEGLDNIKYSSLDCFLLIDWLSFGEGGGGVRLKLDVQDQGDRRILDVDGQGQGGGGVLKIG